MLHKKTGSALFTEIQNAFIGLDTQYTLATGETTKRIYLDSTASTLMMKPAHDVVEHYYQHYANTHSTLHFGAKISTDYYQWAHERMLSFLGANPKTYACFFTGSGTTAGMNRLARIFKHARPKKTTALVSIMEHHSNDLPHRKHMEKIIHVPLKERNGKLGCVCIDMLENICKEHQGQLNYIALTGVSNVTGIMNPIYEAAEIAHRYGAYMIVDGAQLAAHVPVQMCNPKHPEQNIDALVFSGHKTYYPGSPGVVVARKDLLLSVEPEEVGGGMVQDVFTENYVVKSTFPDREEAGTPNIPGAIGLAVAIDILDRIGMDFLFKEEDKLIQLALDKMTNIPGIRIYGETNTNHCKRVASISFNMKDLDHGLTAAILNDYFNIAVRNDCFCAHPYVKEMIMDDLMSGVENIEMDDIDDYIELKRGMVRASFGLYSKDEDVHALADALMEISKNAEKYISHYHVDASGNYVHKSFRFDIEPFYPI
jgi:selenocysteine lyase/cysteine desulfurase